MTLTTFVKRPPGSLEWRRTAAKFIKFGVVGVSGLVINTLALLLAVDGIGLDYLVGVVLATQASTVWNFVFSELWVFDGSQGLRAKLSRFGRFWLLNNSALLLRGPIIWVLTDGLSVHYAVSNIVSLVLIMLMRYAISDRLIWTSVNKLDTVDRTDDTGDQAELDPGSARPILRRVRDDRFDEEDADGDEHADDELADDEHADGDAGDETLSRNGDKPVADPHIAPVDVPKAPRPSSSRWVFPLCALAVAVVAIVLRFHHLGTLGFNSDEAVYAGQGASLAGDAVLTEYFPIFRAHPLLFQTTLSLIFSTWGVSPVLGRAAAAVFGLGTVALCYLLGRTLYGRRAGLIAALLLAVMPYHVIVTRQVLLDGPMVFFSTLGLYFLARFSASGRPSLLYATAGALGMTFLTNERSIVLLGGVYLFFALVSSITPRIRDLALSLVIFFLMVLPYPLSVSFSGKSTTGEQFLAWQLFRRANHGFGFYFLNVPPAMGLLTVLAAVVGIVVHRRNLGWREVLILTWCAVPLIFFQIWPVKGFQYLLALAPPVAVLAGRALADIPDRITALNWERRNIVRWAAVVLVASAAFLSSWGRILPDRAGATFLAGSGGVPGGREAGVWVSANIPEGAELLAIGPSMANIIQWYGDRKTYGLSVSPNPLHRNPVYEPIVNPDLLLRNGDLHYLVWDAFSASRTSFFSEKLLTFAERYHGRIVHQEFVEVETDAGETVQQPVIIIYEVRP